ncbi:hypothetical protein [Sulfolobus monocaudavirus SMV3]|uniref:hypothetical protein n=1 Tax=Sulfolobus monocaudavirus SMV3 TaxID=1732177 RepID=UPI000705ED8F|nr:hypothetical protein AXI69_gp83 [Sulfolobus monocaudavirus SMV3]ALG97020.1 hypothetical protein [Sulfolobus monocaudavirus SMV3]
MDTNDYFLKISEYCNFNIDCIDKTLSDKKKLGKILGIENKKELDNIRFFISTNFDKYVYRNYKKFPKDEIAKFIISNMCGYDFKCMLEILKENNLQDMLDYMLDYWAKTYDIEPIVNEFITVSLDDPLEDLDHSEYTLPTIAWLEFIDRPEAKLLFAMYDDYVPLGIFDRMEGKYHYNYKEVFGEEPEDIENKIRELVDKIESRTEDRLREIAKSIYDETLELINNNPAYKIVDYIECYSYLCYLLDLDKIPIVHIDENRKNQLLNT